MNKWNSDKNIQFIQLYKEHECLWNVKSETYKNKQMRDAALEDIKTKMNIDGFGSSEIKAKIRVLRSTYYQEKKKIQNSHRSGAGTDDLYRPNIKWYDDINEIMTKIESKTPCWDNLENQNKNLQDESEPALNMEPNTDENKNNPVKSPKAKRSKLNKITAIISDMKNLNDKIEDNEFDIFGSSVAAQLKKLSEGQALIAQEQIQSILTRCRLNDVRRRSRISTPLSSSSSWSPAPPLSPPPSSCTVSAYSGEPVETCCEYDLSTIDCSNNDAEEDTQPSDNYEYVVVQNYDVIAKAYEDS